MINNLFEHPKMSDPFVLKGELNKKMETNMLMDTINFNKNTYMIAGIDIDEDGHLDLLW